MDMSLKLSPSYQAARSQEQVTEKSVNRPAEIPAETSQSDLAKVQGVDDVKNAGRDREIFK